MNLVGARGRLGLITLLGGVFENLTEEGILVYNKDRDPFEEENFRVPIRYDKDMLPPYTPTDKFTADNLEGLWPSQLIGLLTSMRKNIGYYLDTYAQERITEGRGFQEGRLEFLRDVRERVSRVEETYGELSSKIIGLKEAGRIDTPKELGELMVKSNWSLYAALRNTRMHLSGDNHTKDTENNYYRRKSGEYSKRIHGPAEIFGAYQATAENLGAIRAYIQEKST